MGASQHGLFPDLRGQFFCYKNRTHCHGRAYQTSGVFLVGGDKARGRGYCLVENVLIVQI